MGILLALEKQHIPDKLQELDSKILAMIQNWFKMQKIRN